MTEFRSTDLSQTAALMTMGFTLDRIDWQGRRATFVLAVEDLERLADIRHRWTAGTLEGPLPQYASNIRALKAAVFTAA